MNINSDKNIVFFLYSMVGAGEERTASILINHLCTSYNLHLVLFNEPIEYKIPAGVRTKILRKKYNARIIRYLTLPFLIFRFLKYCKKEKIDISMSFDNVPNYLNVIIKIFHPSLTVWLRESNHTSTRFSSGLKSKIHRLLVNKLYSRSDLVFVNSKGIGRDLQENFNVDEGKIELFNNPINLKKIDTQQKGEISKPKEFTFIHVGAFREQKNHSLLIEAFALLKDLNVKLWLVGKGPLENSIKDKVKEYGLDQSVVFHGFQENPFKFMAKADCMVLSSNYEGFPNVLMEAIASRLPILSTDCLTGPRELVQIMDKRSDDSSTFEIEIGKNGVLVPCNEKQALSKGMRYMLEHFQVFKNNLDDVPVEFQRFKHEIVIANFINHVDSVQS